MISPKCEHIQRGGHPKCSLGSLNDLVLLSCTEDISTSYQISKSPSLPSCPPFFSEYCLALFPTDAYRVYCSVSISCMYPFYACGTFGLRRNSLMEDWDASEMRENNLLNLIPALWMVLSLWAATKWSTVPGKDLASLLPGWQLSCLYLQRLHHSSALSILGRSLHKFMCNTLQPIFIHPLFFL